MLVGKEDHHLEIVIFVGQRDHVGPEGGAGLVEDVVRPDHHVHQHVRVNRHVKLNGLFGRTLLKLLLPVGFEVDGIEEEKLGSLGDVVGTDEVRDEVVGLVADPVVNDPGR